MTNQCRNGNDEKAAALGRDLVVVSGPSGVGKTTVCEAVARRTGIRISISATTRPMRPGEKDGVDYHFVTRQEFQRRVEAGRFAEWAEVFGRLYGTPLEEIERAGRRGEMLILEIDVQGAVQIKKRFPEALAILLLAPDPQALRSRLSGRGTEAPEEAEARFAKARAEVEMARRSGCYDAEVVNDDLPAAIENVVKLVQARRKQT